MGFSSFRGLSSKFQAGFSHRCRLDYYMNYYTIPVRTRHLTVNRSLHSLRNGGLNSLITNEYHHLPRSIAGVAATKRQLDHPGTAVFAGRPRLSTIVSANRRWVLRPWTSARETPL